MRNLILTCTFLLGISIINNIHAGDCLVPSSIVIIESGNGPYDYTFTIGLDTIQGNDSKAMEITFMLSDGTTETVCFSPNIIEDPIIYVLSSQYSDLSGAITYISWTANNGQCQGGSCSSGSLPPAFPLAVNLMSFEAKRFNSGVQLKWSQSMSEGVGEFFIERSTSGDDFVSVGSVNEPSTWGDEDYLTFEFFDRDAPGNEIYYRLKSILSDGTSDYSEIKHVGYQRRMSQEFYPNPAKTSITISAVDFRRVSILDFHGKQCMDSALTDVDISHLLPGLYVIRIETTTEVIVRELLKL